MTVSELIKALTQIEAIGHGDKHVLTEGYKGGYGVDIPGHARLTMLDPETGDFMHADDAREMGIDADDPNNWNIVFTPYRIGEIIEID